MDKLTLRMRGTYWSAPCLELVKGIMRVNPALAAPVKARNIFLSPLVITL
ncbi:MAG: hypothetical protein ABSE05_02815 [Syntrophales bacterium]